MPNLPDLAKSSFRTVMETDPSLRALRESYAKYSIEERMRAADYVYHSAIADDLFARTGSNVGSSQPGAGALAALVIDPNYAPALLTAGSIEYQYGRPGEALRHFLQLTRLDAGTTDLYEIIEQAGTFLIDVPDFKRAERLYLEASTRFPHAAVFHSGAGYCAARTGRKVEAVVCARKCAELQPTSVALSDLGWALLEAGEYAEARAVLEQALAKDPQNARAQNNLKYLEAVVL